MTDTTPHRATAKQWADAEYYGHPLREPQPCSEYACILELRARVEALEGSYETMRLAALEWGKDVDKLMRWSDQHLHRIMALEAGATCPHIVTSDEGTSYCELAEQQAAAAQLDPIDEEENDRRFMATLAAIENATPEQIRAAAGLPERRSLVERVAGAIHPNRCADPNLYLHEARAAIREVAAYMQENYADTDWVTTAAVACVIADLKEESDR